VVIASSTRTWGAPPPTGGEPLPLLRRHRAKLALGLAAIELIALAVLPGDVLRSWLLLLGIAVACVVLYALVARRLPYALRQIAWTIALAQTLVALFPVFLGASVVIIAIVLVVVVLAGLALLLGDRR
jgi:hypothetical protein